MKRTRVVMVAAAASFVFSHAAAAQWVPASSHDGMDGSVTVSIATSAIPKANRDSAGSLVVICAGAQTMVGVHVTHTFDFQGLGSVTPVRFKFDSLPPRSDSWRHARSGEGVVAPFAEALAQEIGRHATLLVEYRDLRGIAHVVEFRLAGFDVASASVAKACRWKEHAAERRSQASKDSAWRIAAARGEALWYDSLVQEGRDAAERRATIGLIGSGFDKAWFDAYSMPEVEVKPKVIKSDSRSALGMHGTATIRFVIGTNGRVTAARIVGEAEDAFSVAALVSVSKRNYVPGSHLGRPVAVRLEERISNPE